jgi:hypothetical protein
VLLYRLVTLFFRIALVGKSIVWLLRWNWLVALFCIWIVLIGDAVFLRIIFVLVAMFSLGSFWSVLLYRLLSLESAVEIIFVGRCIIDEAVCCWDQY